MNRIIKIVSAVLIFLALMIALYAWMLANKSSRPVKNVAPTIAMRQSVVTTRAIAAGETITADLVKVAEVPSDTVGGFLVPTDVVGRVATTPLPMGVPILESQLNAGLAARIASGERAVAIRVDEQSGVGNRVRPGDFVDVFVLLRRDGNEVDKSEARLLLPRLRVLSYGSASVEGSEGAAPKAQEVIRTAVLAVPAEDIAELALGDAAGKLTLALRNPADLANTQEVPAPSPQGAQPIGIASANDVPANADRNQASAVLADLIGAGAVPRPSASHPATTAKATHLARPSVDVIRAGKLESVAY